jgi:signal transduction histidine kinase
LTVNSWVRRAPDIVRRHPLFADCVLASAFVVVGLVSAASTIQFVEAANPSFQPPPSATVAASMVLLTAPLALRRRFPLSTLVAIVGAFLLTHAVFEVYETSITVLAGSFALYSAAVHGAERWRGPVQALSVAVIAGEVVREIYFGSPEAAGRVLAQGFSLFYNLVILALPCLLGVAVRSLRERQRQLAARAVELEREREENARRAVFEERVRIARDLHDVVAHHVSVMGVQAGAARLVIGRHPAQAEEALGSIERTSRQAVGELQQMLGFLRQEGEVDGLSPQPGLHELPGLAAQLAEANLTVQLRIEGKEKPVPRTVDVSAYRIVQEALTNTVKHARAGKADVRVRYADDAVVVEVVDDGQGATTPLPAPLSGGHGLIGMRERVALHGGELRVGPRAAGGFAVEATFPLNGRSS